MDYYVAELQNADGNRILAKVRLPIREAGCQIIQWDDKFFTYVPRPTRQFPRPGETVWFRQAEAWLVPASSVI